VVKPWKKWLDPPIVVLQHHHSLLHKHNPHKHLPLQWVSICHEGNHGNVSFDKNGINCSWNCFDNCCFNDTIRRGVFVPPFTTSILVSTNIPVSTSIPIYPHHQIRARLDDRFIAMQIFTMPIDERSSYVILSMFFSYFQ